MIDCGRIVSGAAAPFVGAVQGHAETLALQQPGKESQDHRHSDAVTYLHFRYYREFVHQADRRIRRNCNDRLPALNFAVTESAKRERNDMDRK